MNQHNTKLPPHSGLEAGNTEARLGPKVTLAPMSLTELANAQAQIEACVRERDELRKQLNEEVKEHNRTSDRLQLIQTELEKAQDDMKLYMRTATAFAERIRAIGILSDGAKDYVEAALREGLLSPHDKPPAPASKSLDELLDEMQSSPTPTAKREAYDPDRADGYAQVEGKTVLMRENKYE
jgi:hypothetical protein